MITEFPKFKKLELTDDIEITAILKQANLPPYADFQFVNLWIWNTKDSILISELNGNLVVVFSDYVSSNYASGKPFISFIGTSKIVETATLLMKLSKEKYESSDFRLIPGEIALELSKHGFVAEEDMDSNDYVYLVSNMASMDAWPKNTESKNIRRFIKAHPEYTVKSFSTLELKSGSLERELQDVFLKWGKDKSLKDCYNLNEYKAFERLLSLRDKNIRLVSMYAEGIMRGFTVYEIISGTEYAISRFAKADISYDSRIYDILNWEEAKILDKDGIKYYDWEQDLGIPELRYAKMKYKPAFFLRQFIISKIQQE